MKTIKERASLAAWQIFEEIGLSKHSVDRVAEIIEEKICEQRAIDEAIRLKKCDDMTEAEYNREVAFLDWFHENSGGTITHSDAIEWARKDLLDKACEWLKERVQCGVHPQRAYGFAEEFRKAMEE